MSAAAKIVHPCRIILRVFRSENATFSALKVSTISPTRTYFFCSPAVRSFGRPLFYNINIFLLKRRQLAIHTVPLSHPPVAILSVPLSSV